MAALTPIEDIPKIREKVFTAFRTNKSRNVAWRKEQILQIAYMLQDNDERFQAAFKADLGRHSLEAIFLEISAVIKEAMFAYKNVAKWAKPEGIPFDFNTFLMGGKVIKDPQGVVLIIGPFNYPLWCVLVPLIGAISAGCAAVIKPSEMSANVEKLLVELIPHYLDSNFYSVVTAEIEGTTKLLELQWDHIMYTGSGAVGKIVAAAAAKHLTPVSLELGGKSPVIVDKTADLQLTARRVLWGKLVNAGQTCIAPDYLLVTDGRQEALVAAFKSVHKEFFGDSNVAESESFSRIVADRHVDRLEKLLSETKGDIVFGGEIDKATKYVAPTVVKNVTFEDSLMSQELFGPILPIVPVADLDAAITYINSKDRPLMMYPFTNDSKAKDKILANTFSGMAFHNDTLVGAAAPGLPFGGTGPSGFGSHRDKAGFDSFTHRRSTISVPKFLDLILQFRFPPYTPGKTKFASYLLQPKIPYSRPGTNRSLLSSVLSTTMKLTVPLIFAFAAFYFSSVAGTKAAPVPAPNGKL